MPMTTDERISVCFGTAHYVPPVEILDMPRVPFEARVATELNRARAKHPTPMRSAHEALAVVMEEFEEMKHEVFHGKQRVALQTELIQLAAMCQRMAEDLKL